MRNDRLESPIEIQESESHALERMGSGLGGCVTALESLSGSLVQYTHVGGNSIWRYKHPTIGDAFGGLLIQNPELLGIYLQGSPTEKLIYQVTCGDVGLEKAVVISKALFPLMLGRLSEFSATTEYKSQWLSTWGARDRLQGFLARRCSKDFLSLYIEKHPELLDRVSQPGLFLSAVSEVDLALRLHEYGVLPEDKRQKFITTVTDYAVDGQDLYALEDHDLRRIFTDGEFEELRRRVRYELVPRLDEVRLGWQVNHHSDQSAEDHMQPLLESFQTLRKEFTDDPEVVKIVERETEHASVWISEHMPKEPDDVPK
jgi:hypothetical protein